MTPNSGGNKTLQFIKNSAKSRLVVRATLTTNKQLKHNRVIFYQKPIPQVNRVIFTWNLRMEVS